MESSKQISWCTKELSTKDVVEYIRKSNEVQKQLNHRYSTWYKGEMERVQKRKLNVNWIAVKVVRQVIAKGCSKR